MGLSAGVDMQRHVEGVGLVHNALAFEVVAARHEREAIEPSAEPSEFHAGLETGHRHRLVVPIGEEPEPGRPVLLEDLQFDGQVAIAQEPAAVRATPGLLLAGVFRPFLVVMVRRAGQL